MIDLTKISRHRVLSKEECERAHTRVLALRREWKERTQGFYTLGAVSYLDLANVSTSGTVAKILEDNPGSRPRYLEETVKQNWILRGGFHWVYDRLAVFFMETLGGGVRYELAYPGFHIFDLDKIKEEEHSAADRAHYDLQFMVAYPGIIPRDLLSFTLLIGEPEHGACLEWWDKRFINHQSVLDIPEVVKRPTDKIIDYELGVMTMYDGMTLHGVGRSQPGGLRITLQGHGVRLDDGNWRIYW